jgi:hypothetical protein
MLKIENFAIYHLLAAGKAGIYHVLLAFFPTRFTAPKCLSRSDEEP